MSSSILRKALGITIMVILSSCGGGGTTPTAEPTQVAPTDAPTEVVEETEPAIEPTVADGATEVSDEATEESATAESVPEGITATVNFPNATARSGPGTGYPSLGGVSVGTTLAVIAQTEGSNGWYLVMLESGEPGWLWARVVDLNPRGAEVEIAATIPPTPGS